MFSSADYKRWLKFGKIITSNEDLTKDLLQEILIDIFNKGNNNIKDMDNYIFMSIRNRFINHITKKNYKLTEKYDNDDLHTHDIEEYNYEVDYEKSIQLIALENVINTLDVFDKKLYDIHFITGKSQRCISRESGISFTMINDRCKKIKNKIEVEYHKLKNN